MIWVSKRTVLTPLICIFIYFGFCLEPLPHGNPFLISSSGLTAMLDDPSVTIINPAAGLSGISSSTCYLYNMDKLSQCEISSVLEYQGSGVFIGWQSLNNDDYSKQDYRFGYRFNYRFLRAGLGYKLAIDKIPGYGSSKDDCLYTGLRMEFSETTLDLALEPFYLDKENTSPKQKVCNVSLKNELTNNTACAFGFKSSQGSKTSYKVGCRYQITRNLNSTVSWESEPGRFGIGSVFNLDWINLIYAVQTHPELQWTQSLGVSIIFP